MFLIFFSMDFNCFFMPLICFIISLIRLFISFAYFPVFLCNFSHGHPDFIIITLSHGTVKSNMLAWGAFGPQWVSERWQTHFYDLSMGDIFSLKGKKRQRYVRHVKNKSIGRFRSSSQGGLIKCSAVQLSHRKEKVWVPESRAGALFCIIDIGYTSISPGLKM